MSNKSKNTPNNSVAFIGVILPFPTMRKSNYAVQLVAYEEFGKIGFASL